MIRSSVVTFEQSVEPATYARIVIGIDLAALNIAGRLNDFCPRFAAPVRCLVTFVR